MENHRLSGMIQDMFKNLFWNEIIGRATKSETHNKFFGCMFCGFQIWLKKKPEFFLKGFVKACLDYMICLADFVMYDFVMHHFSVYTGITNHLWLLFRYVS